MEEGETEKEKDGIRVESKFFSCLPSAGKFILTEVHKKGERSISLSHGQASWIAEGLDARHKEFGNFRRREAQMLDGCVVVLIENSNASCCFLSIQTKSGKSVPAGKYGNQWKRLADLISGVLNGFDQNLSMKDRLNPGSRCSSRISTPAGDLQAGASNEFNGTQRRSYAQVVSKESNDAVMANTSNFEEKLEMLEKELAEIRCILLPVAARNPNMVKKRLKDGRVILIDPTVRTCSHNGTDRSDIPDMSDQHRNNEKPNFVSDLPDTRLSKTAFLADKCAHKRMHSDVRKMKDVQSCNGIYETGSNSDDSSKATHSEENDSLGNQNQIAYLNREIEDKICFLIEADSTLNGVILNSECLKAIRNIFVSTVKEFLENENLENAKTSEEGSGADKDSNNLATQTPSVDSTDSNASIDSKEGISVEEDKREEQTIVWDAFEQAYIHIATGLRYSPKRKVFFRGFLMIPLT